MTCRFNNVVSCINLSTQMALVSLITDGFMLTTRKYHGWVIEGPDGQVVKLSKGLSLWADVFRTWKPEVLRDRIKLRLRGAETQLWFRGSDQIPTGLPEVKVIKSSPTWLQHLAGADCSLPAPKEGQRIIFGTLIYERCLLVGGDTDRWKLIEFPSETLARICCGEVDNSTERV